MHTPSNTEERWTQFPVREAIEASPMWQDVRKLACLEMVVRGHPSTIVPIESEPLTHYSIQYHRDPLPIIGRTEPLHQLLAVCRCVREH
jgi:hypothetical protein